MRMSPHTTVFYMHRHSSLAMEHSFTGKLRWSKLSAAYRGRLLEGASALSSYLRQHDVRFEMLSQLKAKRMDELLDGFVNSMHGATDKGALRKSKHAVLYIQAVRPRLRKCLQSTWGTLKAWEEEQPSSYRAPLPLPLMAVIICEARKLALEASEAKLKDLWLTFSVLVMIGFYGLLRPIEICSISGEDVSLPNSWSFAGPFAVINKAGSTKERSANGSAAIHRDSSP